MGIERRPADPKAVKVCAEVGVFLDEHRSRGLDAEMVAWADYVMVMEMAHAQHLREHYPEVGERIVLLGGLDGRMNIPDPIGGWTFQFRRSRNQIARCVEAFVGRLPPRGAPQGSPGA